MYLVINSVFTSLDKFESDIIESYLKSISTFSLSIKFIFSLSRLFSASSIIPSLKVVFTVFSNDPSASLISSIWPFNSIFWRLISLLISLSTLETDSLISFDLILMFANSSVITPPTPRIIISSQVFFNSFILRWYFAKLSIIIVFSVGVIILSITALVTLLCKLSWAVCNDFLAESKAITSCVWLLLSAINLTVFTYPSSITFLFVSISNWVFILTCSSEEISLFLK